MDESPRCKECDVPLTGQAVAGLCANCLLKLALEPPAERSAADDMDSAPEEPITVRHFGDDKLGEEIAGESAAPREADGSRIGRYRLLQQIGEGGFGVVWMAEQLEPVTRRVALKIIKAGMDTREVIARFEAERQALAMMDHPNIARVFDAGATDYGRPFFVMELVRGVPITKFCDENQLGTRERLLLFGDVCSAIQHAHQKGIIHRDIKPSNVMVFLDGDKAVPKVIDFGIAKATQGKLTDKTLFTRFEQFIGTPVYMSPEQAGLGGLDVDTRSDIYALGILLYELLTGKPPFDAKSLVSAGYEEMRRIIREVEPPKPSSRLSTIAGDERTTLAKAMHIEPGKLSRMVEPDLDWIVMKAIEKDRSRRYETVNGLGLDIQRFLSDEPVSAGRPTAAYRCRKFARRHKMALRVAALAVAVLVTAALISTALIAAVLVAATVVSSWQAVRATIAEKRASRAGKLATAKAADEKIAREDAEAVTKFLTEVLESPDPARGGRTITVAETLDRAAQKFDTDLAIQPGRRAKLHGSLGRTYFALGLYDEAISQLEKARDYFIEDAGPHQRDALNAMRDLALAHFETDHETKARTLWEEVLKLYLAKFGPEDSDTLWTRTYLAHVYDRVEGRRDEAIKMREEILELRRKISGPDHPDTLFAMHELAISCFDVGGHRDEALRLQETVMALRRRVIGPEHPHTLQSMENLAVYLSGTGRRVEALRMREELLPLRLKVNGPTHMDTHSAIGYLADSHIAAGHWEDAVELMENWTARSASFSLGSLKLSAIQAWLGKRTNHVETCRRVLKQAKDTDRAAAADHAAKGYSLIPSSDAQLLDAALTLARRAVSLGPGEGYFAQRYQLGLGMAEYRNGDDAAAEKTLTAAEQQYVGVIPAATPIIQTTAGIYRAMSCFRQGKVAEARRIFANWEAQMKPVPSTGQPYGQSANHDDLICWLAYKEARPLLFPELQPGK